MRYSVLVIQAAREDLREIFEYLLAKESQEQAGLILEKVTESLLSLEALPGRGNHPPELERLGIRRYRETHCPPFRIIYEIMNKEVMVHCVLDARRDVHDQLMKRLIRT